LKIIHAIIKDVNLITKTIRLESVIVEKPASVEEETVTYDYLIISLGEDTNYFGVYGVENHCMTFRSLQDALKIRNKAESLSANSTVVVVGAGASGVGLAAALSEIDAVRKKN
jgi:NADH dehydrogenase